MLCFFTAFFFKPFFEISASLIHTPHSSKQPALSFFVVSVWRKRKTALFYKATTRTGALGRGLSNNNDFWKKDSKVFFFFFCKRTNEIQDSTMRPLKPSRRFELTWPLRKQPSNLWMFLVRLQKRLEIAVIGHSPS